jgi:hypothetical protein
MGDWNDDIHISRLIIRLMVRIQPGLYSDHITELLYINKYRKYRIVSFQTTDPYGSAIGN